MKRAIILGATGMVGRVLLQQLLESDAYNEVKIFVRQQSGIVHSKLKEFIVDFDNSSGWKSDVTGDVLFSCMGTTLATAGSKVNQYKVDFTYQYEFAKIASDNAVSDYVLVSAAGASSKASTFYLRIKGQLDDAVKNLTFRSVSILKPGQLYGNRLTKRPAEILALRIMFGLNKIGLFKNFKPIHATEVAKAMLKLASLHKNVTISLSELFWYSK